MSSLLGVVSFPYTSSYAATKFAQVLQSLLLVSPTDMIRREDTTHPLELNLLLSTLAFPLYIRVL